MGRRTYDGDEVWTRGGVIHAKMIWRRYGAALEAPPAQRRREDMVRLRCDVAGKVAGEVKV